MTRFFDELPEPGSNATLEIAEEVLGPDHQQWAEDLTRVSLDTPLITVVGGRLIARGEIQPSLLGNHAAFRKAVFTKFGEECEGLIPVGGKERKEVLQLIAAVQPVRDQDEEFANRAAAFLSLRPDQLWQGFDDLENRGILVRGKGGARIAPDLYGDFLPPLENRVSDEPWSSQRIRGQRCLGGSERPIYRTCSRTSPNWIGGLPRKTRNRGCSTISGLLSMPGFAGRAHRSVSCFCVK